MSKKNQNKKNKKEFEYVHEDVDEVKEKSKSTPWSGFGNLDSQALSR